MTATNLPSPRSVLVGRDTELDALAGQLMSVPGRLVTVTGCGGAGKTALAVAVARRSLPDFVNGVWFVDLARLRSANAIPGAVAAAVGLRERADGDLAENLYDFLSERQSLLVLDNCEHLIDGSAAIADALLDRAPGLRILATSREALRITGEQVYALAPLAVPSTVPEVVDELQSYASVALFLERARTAVRDLILTTENAPAVVEICSLLDGIPLALELAAVRANTMTLESMAERLNGGFDLLIARGRSRPERQQTMRAALEWSHDLLSADEQTVLRRLGVFPASWTIDAAEFVCAEPDDSIPVGLVVGNLVDKSLVVLVSADGEARYRLLAPVREYAAGRLAASGETDRMRDQHRAFFVDLAERAEVEIHRRHQAAWINRLDGDLDNLRLAIQTAHLRSDAESVMRLAGGVWWYLWQRGHLREGVSWLEPALADRDVRAAARIAGLRAAGMWHGALGHQDLATGFALEMRQLAADAGDQAQLARAETLLGLERLRQGDLAGTRPHFESALAFGRAVGDSMMEGNGLVNLGHLAAQDRRPAEAESLFRDGLDQFEAVGDRWGVAYASNYLAGVLRGRGDLVEAAELSGRAAGLLNELGDRFYLIFTLEDLARAIADARPETAARLFGAAKVLRSATGALLSPGARDEYVSTVAGLEKTLGPTAYRRAVEDGSSMKIDALLEEAFTAAPEPVAVGGLAGPGGALTRRELGVTRLLAAGRTNREIAAELVIAVGTAGVHVEHILRKLDLRSRHQVADWAREKGLVG